MATESRVSRRRIWSVATVVVLLAFVLLTKGPPAPGVTPPGAFSFAALGDAPYFPWEDVQYGLVLEDMNAHDLSVVLHVGDILWRPCSDARYAQSLEAFSGIRHPVVYTPGDNEWTDCWERRVGGYAPLARLARLREIFFARPTTSLGSTPRALQSQSTTAEFAEFVEHARWSEQGIVFATFHLVGSENAGEDFPGRTATNDDASVRRTQAAVTWLHETFAQADATGAPAVVLAFHANPGWEEPPTNAYRQNYEPFIATLEEKVARFARPVLMVHGDDHEFLVDQPLVRRTTGERLDNLTRMQVPGSPDVGWVRVAVIPGDPVQFSFESRVVPHWKYW